MKIKWGQIVAEGRGKIGGLVASKNPSGAYMRTKVTPTNPSTTSQVTARGYFGASSKAWRGLTAAQRLEWNNATANFLGTNIWGDGVKPSGFQLHNQINNNLRTIGGTPITSPPVPAAIPAFTSMSVAASEGGSTITITYAPIIGATESTLLYATAPLSAGKTFVKSEYRLIDVLLAADVSPYNCAAEWIVKFGTMAAEGTQLFLKMIQIVTLTGLRGSAYEASCIVAA